MKSKLLKVKKFGSAYGYPSLEKVVPEFLKDKEFVFATSVPGDTGAHLFKTVPLLVVFYKDKKNSK